MPCVKAEHGTHRSGPDEEAEGRRCATGGGILKGIREGRDGSKEMGGKGMKEEWRHLETQQRQRLLDTKDALLPGFHTTKLRRGRGDGSVGGAAVSVANRHGPVG